jgi:hypothetical protein
MILPSPLRAAPLEIKVGKAPLNTRFAKNRNQKKPVQFLLVIKLKATKVKPQQATAKPNNNKVDSQFY